MYVEPHYNRELEVFVSFSLRAFYSTYVKDVSIYFYLFFLLVYLKFAFKIFLVPTLSVYRK